MPNLILPVKETEKWVRRGFPGGIAERAHKDLPTLFRRIRELEEALAPFARLAVVNKSVSGNPDTLVHTMYKHCQEAFNKLDPAQSVQPTPLPENAGFGEPAQF